MSVELLSSHKDAQQYVSKAVLGADTSSSVNCGELACQHDSFLKSLETAKLVSYAAFEEKAAPIKKKKAKSKKGDSSAAENNKPSIYSPTRYTIALSDSVFFPEGGGQPADRGVITFNDDIALSVSDAQNINNVCVLTCQAPKEIPHEKIVKVLSSSSSSQNDDATTTTIKQDIDWDRRFDLMTQHSGQHLISAVALNEYEILTHSFSLGENSLTSYIDFTIDPEVAMENHYAHMKHIEDVSNERIRQNLPMTPTWLDPNDPDFETKVRSRLLPAGLTGKIRLMEIGGGVDFNTCCGTHVKTLGSLQMIKFFKMEKVKSTTMRVYFAAGKRLLKIMEESFGRQSKFTNMLSCAEDEHVARLTILLEDKKAKEREIKALNEQLCAFRANEIVEECKANDNVVAIDLGAADMPFMTLVAAAVSEEIGQDGLLLLLVAGADGSEEGSFLLTGDVALVDNSGKQIAELLGGRGGGRNGKFQGKGTKIRSSLADAKAALIEGKAKST